jgi:hypothetical protein
VATTVQISASGFGAGRWLAHALDPSAGGPAAAACDPQGGKKSVGLSALIIREIIILCKRAGLIWF